jgi:hypothetical protein
MPRRGKCFRITALRLAVFTIVIGIAGIVSPDHMMALRRPYCTPDGLYVGGAVRIAMRLVLILAASTSRWPVALPALGPQCACKHLLRTSRDPNARERSLNWRGRTQGSCGPGPRWLWLALASSRLWLQGKRPKNWGTSSLANFKLTHYRTCPQFDSTNMHMQY